MFNYIFYLERIFANNDSSVIYIKNVTNDDTGMYQCFGKNIYGVYVDAVEFQYDHMKSPGSIPTSVKCETKSKTEIKVSWVEPLLLSGSKKNMYTVEWSKLFKKRIDNFIFFFRDIIFFLFFFQIK